MQIKDEEWEAHKINFSDTYDDANYSSTLQSWVMGKSHKLIEEPFQKNVFFEKVLEVGAGTGKHFQYIKHGFSQFTFSDSDARILEYAKQKIKAAGAQVLNFDIQNGDKLDYPDNTFDRVIATHVLEHIYYPHLALKEWARVLKNDGILSVLLPTDPGIAWRVGKSLGPRRKTIAKGIPYDYLMAREHVNSCVNLIAILRHYFPGGDEKWWPTPFPLVDINLFYAFNVRIIK